MDRFLSTSLIFCHKFNTNKYFTFWKKWNQKIPQFKKSVAFELWISFLFSWKLRRNSCYSQNNTMWYLQMTLPKESKECISLSDQGRKSWNKYKPQHVQQHEVVPRAVCFTARNVSCFCIWCIYLFTVTSHWLFMLCLEILHITHLRTKAKLSWESCNCKVAQN